MVVLGLGAWLTYALIRWRHGDPFIEHRFALDWACLIVIAGCLQTSAQRLGRILRRLKAKSNVMSPIAALPIPSSAPTSASWLGVLIGAGAVLALLQFVCRIRTWERLENLSFVALDGAAGRDGHFCRARAVHHRGDGPRDSFIQGIRSCLRAWIATGG